MTRNILVATIFTLGTALLLGAIFLQESPRLEEASGAITAERVERGARDFEQYCATCHGLGGQGGGVGPRINNIEARYYTPDAEGNIPADAPNGINEKYGTLRNYIEATLFSGIRGAPMPAFGAQGTLRQDQIENITSYVLSWSSPVTTTDSGYDGLPEGVAARADLEATRVAPTPDPNANPVAAGGLVFQNKGCVGCHVMTSEGRTGPGLGGLFQPEGTAAFGTVLPNNQPVNEENVRAWINGGTAGFDQNINDLTGKDWPQMPGIALTDEEWAKLLVWLREHNRDGTLTPRGQELEQLTGQEFEPGSTFSDPSADQGNSSGQNRNPGANNVPTVIPTGQAQPNTAPESQQMPTSQVDVTADAESTDATAEAVETTTATP